MKKITTAFLLFFSLLSNKTLQAQGSCASPDGSFLGTSLISGGPITYATANSNGLCFNDLNAGQTYCWTYFYPSSGNFTVEFIKNGACVCSNGSLTLMMPNACTGGCTSVGAIGCGGIQYNSSCAIQDATNIEHAAAGSCTPAQVCNTIYTVCITIPAGCVTMDICPLVYCTGGPANCIGVLPIELLSFTGKNECGKNILSWSSATETNNDYYTIERGVIAEEAESSDIQWETAGTVDGAGNSSLPINYEFIDNSSQSTNQQINKSIIYYRLKQTDFDGKSETFHTIAVKKDCGSELTISPSVTEDEILIRFGNNHSWNSVSLFDSMGRKVFSSDVSKELGEKKIDLRNYSSGLYTVVVSSPNGKPVVQKVILR